MLSAFLGFSICAITAIAHISRCGRLRVIESLKKQIQNFQNLDFDYMQRLGIITGLAQESACLDVFSVNKRPVVRCAGARSERAGNLARKLVNEGCQGLLSYGMAGGLRENLPPGSIIIAPLVIGPSGSVFETSKVWLDRICLKTGSDDTVIIAPIAGTENVINSIEEKKELGQSTNAAAVDMESYNVGAVAKEAGVPFMIIRAIADPLGRTVPDWVLGNISTHGNTRYWAMLAGLAAHPLDLCRLVRLNSDSRMALSSLRSIANRLGPLFALE